MSDYSFDQKVRKRRRSLRNAVVSVLVIIVLLVVGGVVYVLLSGSGQVAPAPKAAQAEVKAPTVIKPTKPGPNAPEGVSVESLLSPVKAGQNTQLSGRTNADSTCTISVIYNNVAATDSGLGSKTADDYGGVTWTWTVPAATPAGSWPIKVVCAYHGRTAVVQTNLQVTR